MTTAARTNVLKYALITFGVIYIVGLYPLSRLWPSGWSWGTGHSHYLSMILGVYATLGVFLIRAAFDPLANRSLIWFTVWSNVVHALVMAAEVLTDPAEIGHLWGDVPVLLVVAAALAYLTPKATTVSALSDRSARRAA